MKNSQACHVAEIWNLIDSTLPQQTQGYGGIEHKSILALMCIAFQRVTQCTHLAVHNLRYYAMLHAIWHRVVNRPLVCTPVEVYCIVLYCIVLYCIVLYCIML